MHNNEVPVYFRIPNDPAVLFSPNNIHYTMYNDSNANIIISCIINKIDSHDYTCISDTICIS